MNDNICNFICTKKTNENINIVNFVYEQKSNFTPVFTVYSSYCIGVITDGLGFLHTSGGKFELKKGCVFFTFPAKPYYIENTENLKYIYISFIGQRASALLERSGINCSYPVCNGYKFIIPYWEETISIIRENNSDLFCEGLLLYTLAHICDKSEERKPSNKKDGILIAKEFIDTNYTDCTITLKYISEKFSYNSKYFSAAFKKLVRVNFSEYLKEKRLRYAVSLIESGVSNVKDLAEMCGYTDPLYFSKSFKQKYGISPKKFKAKKTETI